MATMFEETTSAPKKMTVEGVLAEYQDTETLLKAAEQVRDAGYKKWDVHTPFPVHGLDQAMGVKTTILPFIVLVCGIVGVATALALQYFTNAVDYPFYVSGKPYFSLPASIPVTFELMVLFSAFGALIGMFALNQLPKHANALFHNPRFARATSDRFFIVIEGADPAYNETDVTELLLSTGAGAVETYRADFSDFRFPKPLKSALYTLGILALFLPALIIIKRNTTTQLPPFHIIPDMDSQPYDKAQQLNTFFADGRAMRPQVPGTIARGDLEDDARFFKGIEPGGEQELARFLNASFQDEAVEGEEPAASDTPVEGEAPADGGAPAQPVDNTPWVTEFPIEVNEVNMQRGQARFRIYCSVCHGLSGEGDGLVTQRAQTIGASTWVTPVQLSNEAVVNQPVGKIFNTITHGIRKMPAYASQIPVADRWAIVMYVRALQKSRTATEDQIPEDLLGTMTKVDAPIGEKEGPAPDETLVPGEPTSEIDTNTSAEDTQAQ